MSERNTKRALRILLPVAFLCLVTASGCGGGGGGDDGAGTPLDFTPAVLGGGTSGNVWARTLFASGGAGGYQWQLLGGSLPPGVSGLPASGPTAGLSGVLGAAGTYGFTVRLSDANSAFVDRTFSVTIASGGPGPQNDFTTTPTNAPAGRSGHTAVWTGTEMIVWGGAQQIGLLGDGGAYNPATNTWRTISNVGAPNARTGHTAVWTGTEMIVWGGWDNIGPLGTGGAYNPTTNVWRTVSTANAPQARTVHTAVWTGTTMIVFGGQGAFGPGPAPNSVDLVFGDGGIYNPATNTWTAIAGGQVARSHTAVWTGSQMITWGGRDSFALTISTINLGSLFTPLGAVFTPTSVATAPTARWAHTAVWTGLDMIVWGGSGGFVNLNTGARFLPGSNTWAATSNVGAPSIRSGHTAVWTGTEMVIWGGWNLAPLADGDAYNPATNAWRAVVPGITPVPRSLHTAVWTGNAMIVWGGNSTPADTYLSSGAVIHP